MAQLTDDCFAFAGPLLPVDDLERIINERVFPVDGIEDVALAESRGRVIAADITAPIDLPPFDNSAVDGYALRHADLDPRRAAGRISGQRCDRLADAVRATLNEAIAAGGSSLKDFIGSDGGKGWFQQSHFVYGRAGEPCRACGGPVRQVRQAGRATFFCPRCQR